MNPTKESYLSLEEAYFDFNSNLFDNTLPSCLITLQRKHRTNGYYGMNRFEGKNGNNGQLTDEIALNPDMFGRQDIDVLSTLVHEMVHLWQQRVSTHPCRKAYHDKVWAQKMEELGLMPSDTGDVGGKKTGQKVTHYIMPGGRFETVAQRLLATGGHIHWKSYILDKPKQAKKPGRVKYTCPECNVAVWGKQGLSILCLSCDIAMMSEADS